MLSLIFITPNSDSYRIFWDFEWCWAKLCLHANFTPLKFFFEALNQKSGSTVLSEMFHRLKNIYTSWSYLLKWRNGLRKTEKKQNLFFECPFEIIGFTCWLKLEEIQKAVFFNENLGIFFYKGESNFEKIVNIFIYTGPNHLKVNVIDSSDRFEHVVSPQCTWRVL